MHLQYIVIYHYHNLSSFRSLDHSLAHNIMVFDAAELFIYLRKHRN